MKLQISEKKQNPLFKRWEVRALLNDYAAVPSRTQVAQELAKALNVAPDVIVINRIQGRQGAKQAALTAHVYDSAEQAKKTEPAWKFARSATKAEPKKE